MRELANGVDECQRIYVAREDLIRLRDECLNALANRSEAVPNEDTTIHLNMETKNPVEIIMEAFMAQSANKSNTMVDTADPLAPTAGFFFGSTAKDEWYYRDLEYTVEVINSLLAHNDERLSYYYQASW